MARGVRPLAGYPHLLDGAQRRLLGPFTAGTDDWPLSATAGARLDAWRGVAPVDDASLAVYLGELFEAGRAPATAALAGRRRPVSGQARRPAGPRRGSHRPRVGRLPAHGRRPCFSAMTR